MHGAENGWVGRGIVEQDQGCREGESTGEDLDEEDGCESGVEEEAGGLERGRGRRGHNSEVGG